MSKFSEDDIREMVLRLAHEIRNPLATIKSAVQLIQRLTRPKGQVEEYFASVLGQVRRIDLTVQDMQRFVRLTATPGQPVQLASAVEGAVAAHRGAAKHGEVSLVMAGGPPLRALIDPGHLRLALDELLGNAIRFSPPGSAVTLSWSAKNGRLVALNVDDEGPGVLPEHADRILKPFFSTSTQATGLGLNIAEKACSLAGGYLEWRNLAGEGCRFSMVLKEA
jgi:signal transduction histidine kinase